MKEIYNRGCTKLRNEIETQRTKRNETKYYETQACRTQNTPLIYVILTTTKNQLVIAKTYRSQ
jgi:hypothetical protein